MRLYFLKKENGRCADVSFTALVHVKTGVLFFFFFSSFKKMFKFVSLTVLSNFFLIKTTQSDNLLDLAWNTPAFCRSDC